MKGFTQLELAALRSIFDETPELKPLLKVQLDRASVTERENSGGGFFTHISVPTDAPAVAGPNPLGRTTHAQIAGLERGMGFIVFLKAGRLDMLEGYDFSEGTAEIDFGTVEFAIYNAVIS